ncbi:protein O-mannosyl-transferase TMEM260-like isoform X2 [Bolinopsis microptera]|uniref:protein O-mannosyl-transferase TMEM260-like isoform X2 n=1 Tax=Bolinopsis microptera TaxID=2820187 RepID=UPI00307A6394
MAKGKGKAIKTPHGALKRSGKPLDDYEPEPLFYDKEEKMLASLVFLGSASLYIFTMYPGLQGGDSGELMSTAKDFGVSHPPGYPLFTTMAAIMINLFPIGSCAWKLNLMSSTIAGITNMMMFINVKRFSGSDAAGVLAAGWCGFSRVFWMWSIQGEVFSLSNLFIMVIMYAAWRFTNAEGRNGKYYEAKLGAFLCGLSLTNQHTSVLYIFPTALWVLYTMFKYDLAKTHTLFRVGLRGLAGLSPYLQLPISSIFFNARVTWGDHRSFSDFKKHILREDFGTFRLVSSTEQSTLIDNLMVYFNDSRNELTIAAWILFVVGMTIALIWGSSKQKETMLVYMAMFGTYHIVFDSLANIKNPSGISHGVLERFWLQPSLALCCIAGCGVGMVIEFLKSKAQCPALKYLFLSLAVLAIGYQVQHNYEDCNENDNHYFWHYSRHILDELPKQSILLTSGDFSTNTFRYHTIGEEYRTDVMVMDMQFMQTDWFYKMLMPVTFPDVSFPGLYLKPGLDSTYPFYNLKTFLDENLTKYPVYMCVAVPEAENSIAGHYEGWPFGMCQKFIRVSDNVDPLEYVTTIPVINLEQYPLPDLDRYESETWEYLMARVMLETYTKPSVWLWKKANSINGDDG